MTAQKKWVWNEDKDGESLTDVRELIPVCVCLWSEYEKLQNDYAAIDASLDTLDIKHERLLDDVKDVVKSVEGMKLKKGQGTNWVLHHNDIVINSKKWREMKHRLLAETRDDKQ